jgi:hypothetical protein
MRVGMVFTGESIRNREKMMLIALNEKEQTALRNLGVFNCFDSAQLVKNEELLKRCFRKKALKTHPDRAASIGLDPDKMREAFQNLNDSYQLLMDRIMAHKGISRQVGKVHVRKERSTRKKEDAPSVGFYKGSFPDKKLRFGEYLYYSQMITWEQLIAALSWQFITRPKLGELAKMRGWITDVQILRILKTKRTSERFGLAAVNLGYLSADRCRMLLTEQKYKDLPIGKYFTGNAIFTEKQLRDHLGQFLWHNKKFS